MPKKTRKSASPVKKVKKADSAGRPKGTGRYGCATIAVRVPAHLVDEVKEFALKRAKQTKK